MENSSADPHARPAQGARVLAHRIVGAMLGGLVLLVSPWLLFGLSMSGFRDGMRDVQRAMYPIEAALVWSAIALAVVALVLAWRAPLRLSGPAYLSALALYVAAFAAAWQYNGYLRTFLDYGQGG